MSKVASLLLHERAHVFSHIENTPFTPAKIYMLTYLTYLTFSYDYSMLIEVTWFLLLTYLTSAVRPLESFEFPRRDGDSLA